MPRDPHLEALQVPSPVPGERSSLGEASRQIAQSLRQVPGKVIGFCPTDDQIAVLPAATQIGTALADLLAAPVALLDVNARWSATPQGQGDRNKPQEEATSQEGHFLTRWLAGDRLALLSLPPYTSIGRGIVEMGRLVQSGRSIFEKVLLDFTGLDRLGEHLAAAAHCDGLLLVGKVGVTTDLDLMKQVANFTQGGPIQKGRPSQQNTPILGVILLGAK